MHCRPPKSPLFPYTTLFRSSNKEKRQECEEPDREGSPVAVHGNPRDAGGCAALPPLPVAEGDPRGRRRHHAVAVRPDRKSTRLNSSHQIISYAVFCLKKKNK